MSLLFIKLKKEEFKEEEAVVSKPALGLELLGRLFPKLALGDPDLEDFLSGDVTRPKPLNLPNRDVALSSAEGRRTLCGDVAPSRAEGRRRAVGDVAPSRAEGRRAPNRDVAPSRAEGRRAPNRDVAPSSAEGRRTLCGDVAPSRAEGRRRAVGDVESFNSGIPRSLNGG